MHLSVSFVSWCTYNTRKHTQVHCKCLIFAIVKYGRDCAAAAAAKSLQSCPTLWDPTDGSPPGSPVRGILQARTLKWVAIPFSNAWKWKVNVKSLSHVRPSATPWTAAFQAPPSVGFSRQEYWSGVLLPSPHASLPSFKSCWDTASSFPSLSIPFSSVPHLSNPSCGLSYTHSFP